MTRADDRATDVARRIEELSDEERELLAELLAEEGIDVSASIVLPRAVRDGEGAPLSFAQERLWFLEQLEPGNPFYNVTTTVRLDGPLDADALDASLAAAARRHDALRTAIVATAGEPRQVADESATVRLARVELDSLPDADREPTATRMLAADARRPFDLALAPLARATLVRLAPERHLLHLTVHHVVADGWSLALLVDEVAADYAARAAGRAAEIAPPPISYADFAAWQRERFAGDALEAQLDYWAGVYATLPEPLALPADRPRKTDPSRGGGRVAFELPEPASRGVARLARACGATPFAVYVAAFQALLSRLSGQRDVVVGTPVANRSLPETERVFGLFVNTLALRADVDPEAPFRSLVERTRERVAEALANQDAPFERVVARAGAPRDLATSPLFQALFVHQTGRAVEGEPGALRLEVVDVPTQTAKFDVTLFVVDDGAAARGVLEYATDLFERETADRIARDFVTLLSAAVETPDAEVGALALLDDEARRRALVEWNDTAVAWDAPSFLLHDLVGAAVARAPHAVAVECGGRRVSYERLWTEAAAVSERLRAAGVGPEVAVGVSAERSPELVVATLGILRAGGVYVPLDPELPAERLATMIRDAGCRVVLADAVASERLSDVDIPILPLDAAGAAIVDARAGDEPSPANAAYVIYTSGSTGAPKGVAVPHGAVVNHLLWRQSAYPLDATDRFLAKASISFDISVWETFAPLVAGATLVLAEPGGHRDVAYLARAVSELAITTAHAHPLVLAALLDEPGAWPSLRRLFVGGERLPADTATRFFVRTTAELVHQYGPTETTIDVTAWTCELDAAGAPPIGRPIANASVHVLDARLEPVPAGVVGELYAGGACLARGYHARAAETAAAFVPDPFGPPGARLYRTGDLARRRADGAVEFVGRADGQVKIRGHRVECGEVEAALRACDGVAAAVVTAVAGGPTGARLVAYVVARDGAEVEADALARSLARRLPDAWIPSAFVALDAIPTTSTGKVDRRRLPEPEARRAAPATSRELDAVEAVLAGVWADVLGVEGAGPNDDFFALGGHSLVATRAIARVRERFGVDLPLRAVFEAPTLAAFARRVTAELASGAADSPMPRVDRSGRAALSHAQRRMWLLDRLLPNRATFNLPFAVRLRGPLDVAALRASLDELVARHEALRTRFVVEDGEPFGEIAAPAPFALDVRDASDHPEDERAALLGALVGDEVARPFDLAVGPLARGLLVRLAADEHVLAVVVHHAVADAWSLDVLRRELVACYAARTTGEDAGLAPLDRQYADWAAWQTSELEGGALARGLDFWRETLGGELRVSEVPTDRPRPPAPAGRGARVRTALAPSTVAALREVARRDGVTTFVTIAAALRVVLHRYTGVEDVVLGTPVANRGRREVEDVVGLFVNTVALRSRVVPDAPLAAVLRAERKTLLDAHARADVPFERVVDAVGGARDASRSPIFQVALVVHNRRPHDAEAGPLEIEGVELDPPGAQFDVTLVVEDAGDAVTAAVEYDADLYDAKRMRDLVDHVSRVVEATAADPSATVADVDLLDETERERLVVARNRTAEPVADGCVVARIAAVAAERPNAVAVSAPEGDATYDELVRASRRLAWRLARRGVGRGSVVGLRLDRGAAYVAAALATLELGAAFLPLDPSYPADRLAFMLEDSGATLVVATGGADCATPIFDLDAERDDVAREDDRPLDADATPDDLAYVIYTSGSTGRPKGVALTRGGLANLVHAQRSGFGVTADDRVLQFAALGFDASVSEIFVTLAAGATLVVGDRASTMPGPALASFLLERGVTMATLPPSAIAELPDGLATPRTLVAAGEPLSAALAARWSEGRRLIDAYGPTEATVCATIAANVCERVTIGRPIANVEVYVLDRRMRPVPVGIPGDLYVGGAGVARGYVNRPGLTAAAFVPDPFSGRDGARLYRTGDLARWTTSDDLEFLGRADEQVKVRGFRIEPGEIVAALAGHPDVADAAVVAREDEPGDRRLVAYYVARPGAAPEIEALLARLRERLPESMIPAALVRLDRIPRTPAGKADRGALPKPDGARRLAAAFVDPAGELETVVARVWRETLGVDRVGATDNFFDAGGHSLLLARAHARLEAALGREIPLTLLFRRPTVRGLAEALAGTSEEPSAADEGRARAETRRGGTDRRRAARMAARETAAGDGGRR